MELLLQRMGPLLARSGHADPPASCPLSGAKRTLVVAREPNLGMDWRSGDTSKIRLLGVEIASRFEICDLAHAPKPMSAFGGKADIAKLERRGSF